MLQTKKFQRKIEDFICEKCGYKNIGNGFTNHCQKCLYSKHVDVNPGDRAQECGGLMKPIEINQRGQSFYIKHQCLKCGLIKENKTAKEDSFEQIVEISKNKE